MIKTFAITATAAAIMAFSQAPAQAGMVGLQMDNASYSQAIVHKTATGITTKRIADMNIIACLAVGSQNGNMIDCRSASHVPAILVTTRSRIFRIGRRVRFSLTARTAGPGQTLSRSSR